MEPVEEPLKVESNLLPVNVTKVRKHTVREEAARVFVSTDKKTWTVVPKSFANIKEAKDWIRANNKPEVTYWPMKGPVKATQVTPQVLTEVDI